MRHRSKSTGDPHVKNSRYPPEPRATVSINTEAYAEEVLNIGGTPSITEQFRDLTLAFRAWVAPVRLPHMYTPVFSAQLYNPLQLHRYAADSDVSVVP